MGKEAIFQQLTSFLEENKDWQGILISRTKREGDLYELIYRLNNNNKGINGVIVAVINETELISKRVGDVDDISKERKRSRYHIIPQGADIEITESNVYLKYRHN